MHPTAHDILAVVAEEKIQRLDRKITQATQGFAKLIDEELAMTVRDRLYEEE